MLLFYFIFTIFPALAVSDDLDLFLTVKSSFSYLRDDSRSELFCFPTKSELNLYEFARYQDVGQGMSLPANSWQGLLANETHFFPLYLSKKDKETRFGVYACRNKNDTNKVITFKTPDSANEELSAKRHYVVASVGERADLNVTFGKDLGLPLIWYHNGAEIPDWMNQTEVVIDSVTVNDSGIYECFYEGKRDLGLHALFHLIIRACPTNKWGPPVCDENCPPCYNGGICNAEVGRCVCPPNFNGTNCENPCAEDSFGEQCQNTCFDDDGEISTDRCGTHLFCLPEPYGCSCGAGFQGPECTDDCVAGTFGADCKQECHCASGGTCHPKTGHCSAGCAEEWSGLSCQIPDKDLKAAPSKVECPPDRFGYPDCEQECYCNEACDPMTGECSAGCKVGWQGLTCSECSPQYYGTNCSLICACLNGGRCPPNNGSCECIGKWKGPKCNETTPEFNQIEGIEVSKGKNLSLTCNVSGIPASNISIWSLELSDIIPDVQQVNESLQTASILVQLNETTNFTWFAVNKYGNGSADFTVFVIEPPALIGPPDISYKSGDKSVEIKWKKWTFGVDVGGKIGETIEYRVVFSYDNGSSWNHVDEWKPDFYGVKVSGLEPDTEYQFAILCRRAGEDDEGEFSPMVSVRTACQLPNSTTTWPQGLRVEEVQPTHALLKWRQPQHHRIGCGVEKYVVKYWVKSNTTSELSNEVGEEETEAYLYHLLPKKDYVVQVSVIAKNKEVVGTPREIEFRNDKSVTSEVEKVQNVTGPQFIQLNWEAPSVLIEEVTEYQLVIELIQRGDCQQTNSKPEIKSTKESQMNFTSLHPYSQYEILIQPMTALGPGEDLVIRLRTKEDYPDIAPSNVRLNSKNEYEWDKIPCGELNGKLLRYEYAEKNSSDFIQLLNETQDERVLVKIDKGNTFVVRAVTSAGPGPWSTDVSINVIEEDPLDKDSTEKDPISNEVFDPVQNLAIVETSVVSVKIKWQPPSDEEHVLAYQVNYRLADEEQVLPYTQINTTDLTVELNALSSESKYQVNVIVLYKNGQSEPVLNTFVTDKLVASDKKEVPTGLEDLKHVAKERSVKLEWVEPTNEGNNDNGYKIVLELIQQGKCNITEKKTKIVETNENQVTVTGLHPFSQYYVTIMQNGVEVGFLDNVTTKETSPDSPPANIRIVKGGEVEWDDVPCDLVNGKLSHYEYILRTAVRSKRSIEEPSPIVVFDKTVIPDNTTEDDEILLRGVTSGGPGPWSTGLPLYGKPPPRQLTKLIATTTELEVEWQAPLDRLDVLTYNVSYRMLATEENNTLSYGTVNTTDLSIILSRLVPSSTYMVKVYAVYPNGQSEGLSGQFDTVARDESRYASLIPIPPPPKIVGSHDGKIKIRIYPIKHTTAVLRYQVIVENADNDKINPALLDRYDPKLPYYVAAEFEMKPQVELFTVGDGTEHGGYYNVKLNSSDEYRIYIRAVGAAGASPLSGSEDGIIEVAEQKEHTGCSGWACHWFLILMICVCTIVILIVVLLIVCSQRRKQTGTLKISQSEDYLETVANSKRSSYHSSSVSKRISQQSFSSTKRISEVNA